MNRDTIYKDIEKLFTETTLGMHKTDGLILESEGKQYTIKVVEKKTKYEEKDYTRSSIGDIAPQGSITENYQKLLDRELSTDKVDYKLTDEEWSTVKIMLKDYFHRKKEANLPK